MRTLSPLTPSLTASNNSDVQPPPGASVRTVTPQPAWKEVHMSTRDELIDGVTAIRNELLARAQNPATPRQDVVAASYVIGWIETEAIPHLIGIPEEKDPAVEAVTDQLLAGIRDNRGKHG